MPDKGTTRQANGVTEKWTGSAWVRVGGGAGADTASKVAVEDRMKSTDLGRLGKKLDSDAPKQEAGETPAQFGKRFREYQEARAKKKP